jgi:predicted transcriptional regulator
MKGPYINVEEKIDRFVGRRTKTPDSWKAGMQLQATGLQLHRALRHRWRARGVHRFKTHEEANQWMMNMLAHSAD